MEARIFYIIFEVMLFVGLFCSILMQKDYFKKWKTYKTENVFGKTEIIIESIIILFCDLFLGMVFAGLLYKILN